MKIISIISFLSLLTFIPAGDVKVVETKKEDSKQAIEEPTFLEFLSLFKKADMPFEVTFDDFEVYQKQKQPEQLLKKQKRKSAQNEDQFLLNSFLRDFHYASRMGPPKILPVARFYPNEKTIALIYIPYRAFGNSEDLLFQMVTFDLEGKRIQYGNEKGIFRNNSFTLGHNSTFEEATQTFRISANGQIEQQTFKAIRKKNVKKVGFKNNPVVDYVLEKTEKFVIDEKGVVTTTEEENSTDRAFVE